VPGTAVRLPICRRCSETSVHWSQPLMYACPAAPNCDGPAVPVFAPQTYCKFFLRRPFAGCLEWIATVPQSFCSFQNNIIYVEPATSVASGTLRGAADTILKNTAAEMIGMRHHSHSQSILSVYDINR